MTLLRRALGALAVLLVLSTVSVSPAARPNDHYWMSVPNDGVPISPPIPD